MEETNVTYQDEHEAPPRGGEGKLEAERRAMIEDLLQG